MKACVVLLALCAGLHGQDAVLEGSAVDSSTGRPLPGVHIRIITLNASLVARSYGAMTDSAGHFSIAKIPAGSYFCLGERAGYLTLGKAGRGVPLPPVILKAGERVLDFKLEMIPRATVSGRVLDEFGDPVQYAQVQITPVSPDAPVAALLMGSNAQTDDRGEYHLPAAPGTYRVRATVFQQTSRPVEIRTDGTSPAEYVPTTYPEAVSVASGAEVNGIDIHLGRRASGAPAGPEGTVSGIPDSRGWATVHLIAREAEQGGTFSQMTQTSGEGRFSFRNLAPGNYRMFARYTFDNKALISQTVEFHSASPPSGVVLRLAPAPDVSGTVAFDGGELPAARRTITLRPADSSSMTPTPSGEIDGSQFRIAGVFPGKYRVVVQPLPENAYVRAVEADGSAAVPEELEISGAPRLKVTIGRNAAQISGNVIDKDGARVQNTLGGVLLLRDPSKIESANQDNMTMLDASGTYSFKGLRPGKYWLIAFDAIRAGNVSNEQLKKFVALAEVVELKEGDRARKDLTIATKEALDAKGK